MSMISIRSLPRRPGSDAPSSAMGAPGGGSTFKRDQPARERAADIAVKAEMHQPRFAEEPEIGRASPGLERHIVPHRRVGAGEQLHERDPSQPPCERLETD